MATQWPFGLPAEERHTIEGDSKGRADIHQHSAPQREDAAGCQHQHGRLRISRKETETKGGHAMHKSIKLST